MELNKTNWKLVAALVLIAATVLILLTTTQEAPTQSIPTQPEPTPEPEAQEQRAPTTINQQIQISEYGYFPDEIRAIQQDNLTLTLQSTDGLTHGFAIEELEISQRIEPGEAVTLNIPTNQPGEYEIYSNVASHSGSAQMRATLTIEERR